jgi:hypothetical protein
VHALLAAQATDPATPWWFPYAAALLAAVGPVGTLVRSFARSAEVRQLERVAGIRTVLDQLELLGHSERDGSLRALSRRIALRDAAEDELRIASAAYLQLAARRPGSIVGGLLTGVYGVLLIIAAIGIGSATPVSTVNTITTLVLFLGALFLLGTCYAQVRRRLRTRSLRLSSGLPDELTREAFREALRSEGHPIRGVLRYYVRIMTQ